MQHVRAYAVNVHMQRHRFPAAGQTIFRPCVEKRYLIVGNAESKTPEDVAEQSADKNYTQTHTGKSVQTASGLYCMSQAWLLFNVSDRK